VQAMRNCSARSRAWSAWSGRPCTNSTCCAVYLQVAPGKSSQPEGGSAVAQKQSAVELAVPCLLLVQGRLVVLLSIRGVSRPVRLVIASWRAERRRARAVRAAAAC
jgi:hypothetical protein